MNKKNDYIRWRWKKIQSLDPNSDDIHSELRNLFRRHVMPNEIQWLINLAFEKILNALLFTICFVITIDVTAFANSLKIFCSQYKEDLTVFYERLIFSYSLISPHAFIFGEFFQRRNAQFIIMMITFFIMQSVQNIMKLKYKQLSELLIDGYMRSMVPIIIPNVINPLIPLNLICWKYYYHHCICKCGKYVPECECIKSPDWCECRWCVEKSF